MDIGAEDMSAALQKVAAEIAEQSTTTTIDLVGLRTRGVTVADRLAKLLADRGLQVRQGVLDVSLYRDDLSRLRQNPRLMGSEINFPVDDSHVILVDDVLFTGRTIRAALEELFDYGRPASVRLAVVADRGHRELPIEANFTAFSIPTSLEQKVKVRLSEHDGHDAIEVTTS